MNPLLKAQIPVCDAIALLLKPQAEVVLHDLESATVAHIANSLSPRRIGDDSLLGELGDLEAGGDVIGPYEKINPDGRRLKSITSILRDGEGRAYGLLCINLDVDVFQRAATLLQGLIALPVDKPVPAALFSGDWREGINSLVGFYLNAHNTTLSGLGPAGQDALLAHLDRNSAFSIRTAIPYVAELLGWSRTKLYNRLKQIRESGDRK